MERTKEEKETARVRTEKGTEKGREKEKEREGQRERAGEREKHLQAR